MDNIYILCFHVIATVLVSMIKSMAYLFLSDGYFD